MTPYVYLGAAAGLGDVLNSYFSGRDFLALQSIRQAHPDVRVRLILASESPGARELFAFARCFDEVHIAPFDAATFSDLYQRNANGATSLLHTFNAEVYKPQILPIYLSGEELKQASEIMSRPYVFVHPFSADRTRRVIDKTDLDGLIDALLGRGLQVVLAGGSHSRVYANEGMNWFLREEYGWNRDGLINFVNGSVRLSAYLASRANFFLGSCSAYCVAAVLNDVPGVIAMPHGYCEREFQEGGGIWGQINRSRVKVHRYDPEKLIPVGDWMGWLNH